MPLACPAHTIIPCSYHTLRVDANTSRRCIPHALRVCIPVRATIAGSSFTVQLRTAARTRVSGAQCN